MARSIALSSIVHARVFAFQYRNSRRRKRLLHFLAREIELRGGEQHEHENGEEMAIGQAAHDLGTKLEQAGAKDVIAELLVLEQSDDDAEQAKDTAAGN